MNLDKLKQEAEALKNTDASQMTPDQLAEFINKLASLLDQSEQSLKNMTLIEINKPENNETDN
jgi:acyl-CoA reductase-like NAD-dependent aldehyde dehydrogenase